MKANTGSIVYDASRGKYRASLTTPGGRVQKRFNTKQEAQDWMAQQQNALLTGTYVEPSRVTLGQWLVTWLRDYKKSSLGIRTFERYTELAGKCAPIAGYPLQAVTAPMVQQLYTDLQRSISPSTVQKVHKVLKAAMHKAMQLDLVHKNVIDIVEPPRFRADEEITTFNRTELDAILDSAKKYSTGYFYQLILLAITTGARMGELLALRWSDIDVKKNEIRILLNLQSTRKGLVFNPPKTKAGRRTITIPRETMTAVLKLRDQRKVVQPNGLVFCTRKLGPLDPHNVERAWRDIVKRSGTEYRNFHVLRHTHATDLLAAGVPIVEVAHRLGHAKITHTLELYGHAIPTYDKEIAEKVTKLYLVN